MTYLPWRDVFQHVSAEVASFLPTLSNAQTSTDLRQRIAIDACGNRSEKYFKEFSRNIVR